MRLERLEPLEANMAPEASNKLLAGIEFSFFDDDPISYLPAADSHRNPNYRFLKEDAEGFNLVRGLAMFDELERRYLPFVGGYEQISHTPIKLDPYDSTMIAVNLLDKLGLKSYFGNFKEASAIDTAQLYAQYETAQKIKFILNKRHNYFRRNGFHEAAPVSLDWFNAVDERRMLALYMLKTLLLACDQPETPPSSAAFMGSVYNTGRRDGHLPLSLRELYALNLPLLQQLFHTS